MNGGVPPYVYLGNSIDASVFFSDQASFCCVIDGDGEMLDYMRLVHFTKRRKSFREDDRRLKVGFVCFVMLQIVVTLSKPI